MKASSMARIARHVALFLASLAIGAVFYRLLGTGDRILWLSMSSAYGSLLLLALTLAVGPWNKLRGRPNPVSGYLRRDIGIWAGILGIVHVIAGLQVHMHGKMWAYFLPEKAQAIPLRIDPFGLTNWAGAIATLILVILLVLSNDASLRALGRDRWKSLQRWNYAVAILVIAHGAVYQILERRPAGYVAACVVIVLAALAMQLAGVRKVRNQRP
jgi:sulfoxide reductase heme-binding subunit YedZ